MENGSTNIMVVYIVRVMAHDTHAYGRGRSSWAEDDIEPPVAAASFGPDVVGLVVRVGAAGVAALNVDAGAAGEVHGEVVPVDDGDVVEVSVATEGELGQRQRGLAGQGAGERAAAVAGAASPAVAVEAAARAAPDPGGAGAVGDVEVPCLAAVELPPAAHRGGRRPHGEGAAVRDGEAPGASPRGQGRGQEEDERRRRGGHCFLLA